MRVETEYKKIGNFWLSGKEDNRLPGVLCVHNGGMIELEVLGHFGGDFWDKDEIELERIIGMVEDEGYVTLENCWYIHKRDSFPNASK